MRSSKKSWNVDHQLDDLPSSRSDGSEGSLEGGPADVSGQLETPLESRARRRSHFVVYAVMFVNAVGFSVVLSGVWPYLHELNADIGKEKLGYPVAANPLGQMIAAPLLGLWATKSGSIRGPMLAAVLVFIGGNVFYSFLYAFQDSSSALYMMILARFTVGVSSANVAVVRSYISAATTQAERTGGLAGIAASQAAGVFVGPLVQALLVVALKETRVETGIPGLVFDKYTTPSWFAAILGAVVGTLVLFGLKEYPIAKKEFALLQKQRGAHEEKQPPLMPDKIGLAVQCVAFGMVIYMTSLRETLATPIVADQYGIENGAATLYVSIALMVGGLISIFVFLLVGKLGQRFGERKVMIYGYVQLFIGLLLHYPMGNTPIVISEPDTSIDALPGAMTPGCPADKQEWCNSISQITPPQLIVTYLIMIFAYPLAMSLSQTTFSKILGPAQQGVWMGLLTGCGSLARVTGPIWISITYTEAGTIAVYMILAGLIAMTTALLIVSFKHLEPMAERKTRLLKGIDNPNIREEAL